MKKNSLLIPVLLMIAILAVLIVFMCLPFGQTRVEAVHGALDLRGSDLTKSVYQLRGQWQYTPGRLVEPEDFPESAAFTEVPKNWGNDADDLNTCATYRLTVYTEDTRQLILHLSEIYTAYRLYINGEYLHGVGVVADNAKDGEPNYESVLIPVKADGGEVEIVIQASNYHWMRPHMNNIPLLGESGTMLSWFYTTRALYIIAMGFILAAAFYHFALYALRRNMKIYLLFALLCLVCFWRLALETDGLSDFAGWFAAGNGVLDGRIFTALFFLHCAFIGVFSLYVFDREWLIKRVYWVVGFCAVGAAAFWILPLNMPWIKPVFAVSSFIPIAFVLYKALRSRVLRESKMMWLYVVALVLYLIVGSSSKLFADHLLFMTPALTNMYMVMAQSVILAAQYANMEARERALTVNNEMLDQLSRMKTELFQNINHDLKAPLAVASTDIANVVSLFDHELDEGEARESLANAQSEIMRMARMVSSAIDYTFQNDNRQDMTSLDIAPLLRGGADTYRALLESHGNTLTMDIPEFLPLIFGNADTLLHVLANLLSNANRHTRDGEIIITAAEKNGFIAVSVEDNGEGVDPEILPRIFERGVSASVSGSGIGLSICKTAVEAMDGTIRIDSEYGKGTAVMISLPVWEGKKNE
ncbi:MAG: sensor histidine kinase [Oscillospiraceae bacterium]|jgi:signal transduction histidine kinase|nr:sensor histidine kinase [Oscillospiraceae bacterium]